MSSGRCWRLLRNLRVRAMAKRTFDVMVSAIGLAILSPLFLVIAVAIKLNSPGPVFYRGLRAGQYGHPFRIYKFRTMVVGANRIGPGITPAKDDRVTSIGRVLRRFKLDEFPQLLNVLKGEMSLVGPRPEDPRYVALYTPEQREILNYRPGITSPASIKYRNEEGMLIEHDWETRYLNEILPVKLALDLEYVRSQSFLTDIAVIMRTLLTL